MRDVSDDEKGNPEIRSRLMSPRSDFSPSSNSPDASHGNGRTAIKLGGQLTFARLTHTVDTTPGVGRKTNNTMSHALLLRLFLAPSFFTVHVALQYLALYSDNIGITYYLTRRLNEIDPRELRDVWGFIW